MAQCFAICQSIYEQCADRAVNASHKKGGSKSVVNSGGLNATGGTANGVSKSNVGGAPVVDRKNCLNPKKCQ